MVTLKVVNMEGAEQPALEGAPGVFDSESYETLVHEVIVGMLAAKRQGNHDTKTRSEVSGGGKKPFRQKGTGRARRGSIREPHLRGGGTVFGPHPRSYRNNITVGMKRKALCSILSDRTRNGRLLVLADLAVSQARTKPFAQMLNCVVPGSRRTLLVTADYEAMVLLSSRNLPNVDVRTAAEVSPLDALRANNIVLQNEAVAKLEERLT